MQMKWEIGKIIHAHADPFLRPDIIAYKHIQRRKELKELRGRGTPSQGVCMKGGMNNGEIFSEKASLVRHPRNNEIDARDELIGRKRVVVLGAPGRSNGMCV